MLLVIHNLPLHTSAQDVQSLVRARCGIGEMILDKLVRKTNNSQSVTIGVANEREADAVMRSMHGYFLDGQQLRVEDLRSKNKPAGRSDYYANDSYQNRGQRPDNYSNNQHTYRPPAPVMNPYEANMSQSIQTMIPPAAVSQTYTGFGMGSSSAASVPQNTYMDYGTQQQPRQHLQLGSNLQGQVESWTDASSQYKLPSLMEQDFDPGPSRRGNGRQQPSGETVYDCFSKKDNKRSRSPDHGGSYNRDRRAANDNSSHQIGKYKTKAFPEKSNAKDFLTNEHASNKRDVRGGFSGLQSDLFEPFRGGKVSNSDKHKPTAERSSFESRASEWQRKPYYEVHMDREDKYRNPQNTNSRGNEILTSSYKVDQKSQNSNSRRHEHSQQSVKTEQSTRNSSSRWNENSIRSYKVVRKTKNSNNRWNEPREQSLERERNTQNAINRRNETTTRSYRADRKPQNSNSLWNTENGISREQSSEMEQYAQNFISHRNEISAGSSKIDKNAQLSNKQWNATVQQAFDTERKPQKSINPWSETPQQSFETERNPQKSFNPWNETLQQIFETKLNSQKSINPWNETLQQTFETKRNSQKSINPWNESQQRIFETERNHKNTINPWNEIPRQYCTTEQVKKTISRRNQTPQKLIEADLNLGKPINVWDEPPYQRFMTDPDIPTPKGYNTNKGNECKVAVSHEREPQSIYLARNWRNVAVMSIAKEIIDARLNFELGKKKFVAAAARTRRLLKDQVEDVIKCEYPREKFAVVPVEEITKLYRRKFTTKDDDELFISTFMCERKANALCKAKGSPINFTKKNNGPAKTSNKKKATKKPKNLKTAGIVKVFTPDKPTKYYTLNQPDVVEANSKNAGVGSTPASSAQTNQPNPPNPDKLPQYVNGDKKQTFQQKQMRKREFLDDEVYKCSPELEKALNLELEDLCKQYVLACETSDENEKAAAQLICNRSLPEFKKTIRLHLTKRLLNIQTNLSVRIFANGRAPSRSEVEEALKPYGVYILKKSNKAKFMYVATCDSYESYDKLCATEEIPAKAKGEDTLLVTKPFQLTMPYKFRRQINKVGKRAVANLQIDGMQVCENEDDGIYEDATGGMDDDDVQIIETGKENIDESIVIDDTNDDVVEVNDVVIESKSEEVDEKSQDNKGSDLPKETVVPDDKNATVHDDKGAAVHNDGDDVDIDDEHINEDDLEDY